MQIFRNFKTKYVLLEQDPNTQHNTPSLCLDCKLFSALDSMVSIMNTIDNTRAQKQHLTNESATTNYQEIKVENLQKKSSCMIMTVGSFHRCSTSDSTSELLIGVRYVLQIGSSIPLMQLIQNTNNKYQIQTYHYCTKPASPKQLHKTPYRHEKLQPPWSSEIW